MATKVNRLWTVAEAAAELSVPRRTLYRWLGQVSLPAPLLERRRDRTTLLTDEHVEALRAFAEGVVTKEPIDRILRGRTQ
jgi:excisionase family DNA binding protein